MSADPSHSLQDAPLSSTRPSETPSPSPFAGPPRADTVVRPFTSQGSFFANSGAFHLPAHAPERPSSARGLPIEPPHADVGPYTSASARTSYTRVDVESLPAPVYPPLPPLPVSFAVHDPPAASTGVDSTALPPSTTLAATAMPALDPAFHAVTEPVIPQTPHVSLTFLLVSGSRKTQTFEPETTVGRVKELVWNAWPARDADWPDERPPAPSYLRILYLGKILQDDDTLLRVGFPSSLSSESNTMSPTIVHLSIRPYVLSSDDPALNKKRRLSIAISRRLSATGVSLGGPGGLGRDGVQDDESEARRSGCCAGCTIC